ncbi:phage tail protein [Komagataeibacter rhaeticus]|nr:phage tail protein [Komagataeibacter rhaeticus]
MSALSHTMGGDLDLSATGGVAVVTGRTRRGRHCCAGCAPARGLYMAARLWRRLPARVGGVMDEGAIRALVLEQMQADAGVDQTRAITVSVTSPKTGACLLAISYTDARSGAVQELALTA